jgi:hypothetical protein
MKDTCTHFIASYLALSLTAAIPMAESDSSASGRGSESNASESLGVKTLQVRSMILASFRETPPETGFWILLQYLRHLQNAREPSAALKSSSPQSATA